MVFLPGEVVVDYSLRLKKELDGRRLWVNGLRQQRPVLHPVGAHPEGGRLRGRRRDDLLRPAGAVRAGAGGEDHRRGEGAARQAVRRRRSTRKKTGGTLPLSPQQSLAAIRDEDRPGGRSRRRRAAGRRPGGDRLRPRRPALGRRDGRLPDRDGRASSSRAAASSSWRTPTATASSTRPRCFLDNIPFPTGVTVWRKGVLVCAAPDILYAEDTNGDGKADMVKKLFTGFGTRQLPGAASTACSTASTAGSTAPAACSAARSPATQPARR